jgi:hypothetical protein
MPKGRFPLDAALAREAKSLVALAFRNGPIEHVHAGRELSLAKMLSGFNAFEISNTHGESLRSVRCGKAM